MVKGQLSCTIMGLALISAAFGMYAILHLAPFSSGTAAPVTLSWMASAQPNRIFCEDGRRRQYSNIHHGWVCSTE